jgi:probable HAF family extracellular repeat protein
VLTLPDTFTPENFPGSDQTQVIGIAEGEDTDGFYITANVTHGFLRINGVFSTVDFPGTTFNQLLGLNNRHQAAGYFADAAGIDRPYIFAINGGVFSEIFIPAAALNGAQATGINDRGVISGFFIDCANITHGFLLDQGTLITLDVPGSTSTSAFGVNNRDQVVGAFTDSANQTHGFLFLLQEGRFVFPIDDPFGIGTTTPNGINDFGQIVGFYVDAAGNTDGFLATPREDNSERGNVAAPLLVAPSGG